MMIDPGGDSTFVVDLGGGKYEVIGAETISGDRGVYVATADEKGNKTGLTGEKLGNSITTHSFVKDNGEAAKGAVIDMNSREGQKFLAGVITDNPSLIGYMWHGQNGNKYDIKDEGYNGESEKIPYYYRGSVDSKGDIGSARDFGNIGAGLVAARKGLSWKQARFGFDLYQGISKPFYSMSMNTIPGISMPLKTPLSEGLTTQKAQMIGFLKGLQMFKR